MNKVIKLTGSLFTDSLINSRVYISNHIENPPIEPIVYNSKRKCRHFHPVIIDAKTEMIVTPAGVIGKTLNYFKGKGSTFTIKQFRNKYEEFGGSGHYCNVYQHLLYASKKHPKSLIPQIRKCSRGTFQFI